PYLQRNRTLCERLDEERGRYDSPCWMMPAKQRLRADDNRIAGTDLGLEIKHELLVIPCAAEFIVEHPPRLSLGAKRRDEIPDASTTGALGAVQGKIGAREQAVGIGAVSWRNGNSGARGNEQLMSVNLEARRKCIQLSFCA